MSLKVTQQYYIQSWDEENVKRTERDIINIDDQLYRYVLVGYNRLRGIEYNVYELRPVSEKIGTMKPNWKRYLCFRWPRNINC